MKDTPAYLETDQLSVISDRKILLNQNQWPVFGISVFDVELAVYVLDAGMVAGNGDFWDAHVYVEPASDW